MWNPFKVSRTCIAKSSRLFISFLVIQDHIESIGKPILIKEDEVLLGSPTGSITLVSYLREIPTTDVLHHPFLFGEKST